MSTTNGSSSSSPPSASTPSTDAPSSTTSSTSSTSSSSSPPTAKPHPPIGSAVKNAYTYRLYTPEEVAQHSSSTSMWVIIHGCVYDVHAFLEDHPGGPEILSQHGGKDATQEFEETFHSPAARGQLKDYVIGGVVGYEGTEDAHLGKPRGASKGVGGGVKEGTKQGGGGMSPMVMGVALLVVVVAVYLAVTRLT